MISTEKFRACLRQGSIPPEPPVGSSIGGYGMDSVTFDHYSLRREATEYGMWAIVDEIWTKKLAAWIGNRTCLEVMAGAGWLAKALSKYGVDIIATDNGSWDARHSRARFVYAVEKLGGIEAVAKYAKRDVLIASWPPYGETAICRICEKWGSEKPIIYIGEGEGGCNAPDEFWNRFHVVDDEPDIPLMAWSGLHDHVFIGHYMHL